MKNKTRADSLPKPNRQQVEKLKQMMREYQKRKMNGQDSPLKENHYPRLTPEQIEMSRLNQEDLAKAVIQGLHQDNQEIFGKDYDQKK